MLKVLAHEMEYTAIVSSHLGLQQTHARKVQIPQRMVRDTNSTEWKGHTILCLYFESPQNAFPNVPATIVMGRPVNGNVIIISKTLTAQNIKDEIDRKTLSNPKSWSALAMRLPKSVPLDEASKKKKEIEYAERLVKYRHRTVETIPEEEEYEEDFTG